MAVDDAILGGGWDEVSYEFASGPVQVDLRDGRATGADGDDQLSLISAITGSPYNDTLMGDAGQNTITGLGGDDVMNGRASYDTLDYFYSPSGVQVDLVAGTAEGEGSDVISGFEIVSSTAFNDRLAGDGMDNFLDGGVGSNVLVGRGGNYHMNAGQGTASDGDNHFRGGSGDDEMLGGAGNDQFDGGPGIDLCLQGEGVGATDNCENGP